MKTVLLAIVFLCFAVQAQQPIRIGLHYSAPWAYVQDNGELTGIDYEIVREIFTQAGYEITTEVYAHERLVQKFIDKELDFASPMAVKIDGPYYTVPYLPFHDVAVTRADNPLELNTPEDLRGKAIVAYQKAREIIGPEYAEIVASTPYLEMADRERQFDLLFNNKVDVIVGDRYVLEFISRQQFGEKAIRIHKIFTQVTYPAASWEPGLVKVFNEGIAKMRESDSLHKAIKDQTN